MPYCPLRLLAKETKASTWNVPSGYSVELECSMSLCGFWAEKENKCGVACIGQPNILPQPEFPEKDTSEQKALINPKTSA